MTVSQIITNMKNQLPYNNAPLMYELVMGFDFTVKSTIPYVEMDIGSSFKYKYTSHYASALLDSATSTIDNPLNYYTTSSPMLIYCIPYYKYSSQAGRCIPNIISDEVSKKSLLIMYANKFTLPLLLIDYYLGDFTIEFWLEQLYLGKDAKCVWHW